MSSIEELLEALLKGSSSDIVPSSRVEACLKNCLEGLGAEGLPPPQSRFEAYLHALAEQMAGGSGDSGGWAVCNLDNPRAEETLSSLEGIHVKFPEATTIGMSAFHKNTYLGAIYLPAATTIKDNAFSSCGSLTTINLPVATSIGYNAFNRCISLTTINLPVASVVNNSAFAYCTSLPSVNLPAATSIGIDAFAECTALTTVNLPAATRISEGAFSSCRSLTTINLPVASVVNNSAFTYCTSLPTVNLPVATAILSSAFQGCTALTTVNLPAATYIYEYTFYGCGSLTTINLPAATGIDVQAFLGCTSLTAIDLPVATSIGMSAFSGCTSLTAIDLPVATSIGNSAFLECTSLTAIDLPKATSIGEQAFWNCTSLSTLILRSETMCELNVTAILDTKIVTIEGMPTGEGFVYVRSALFEDYVANLTAQAAALTGDAATAEYIVRAILRKIEDYPEICGPSEPSEPDTPDDGKVWLMKDVYVDDSQTVRGYEPADDGTQYYAIITPADGGKSVEVAGVWNDQGDGDRSLNFDTDDGIRLLYYMSYFNGLEYSNWHFNPMESTVTSGTVSVYCYASEPDTPDTPDDGRTYLIRNLALPDYDNCGSIYEPVPDMGVLYHGILNEGQADERELGTTVAFYEGEPDDEDAFTLRFDGGDGIIVKYTGLDGWHFDWGSSITSGNVSVYSQPSHDDGRTYLLKNEYLPIMDEGEVLENPRPEVGVTYYATAFLSSGLMVDLDPYTSDDGCVYFYNPEYGVDFVYEDGWYRYPLTTGDYYVSVYTISGDDNGDIGSQYACPDCGEVYEDATTAMTCCNPDGPYTCPSCGEVYDDAWTAVSCCNPDA